MNFYYAEDNVVYDQDDKVMLVVAPVGFRKWVAKKMAEFIAESMNDYEYDSRDVLRGADFH